MPVWRNRGGGSGGGFSLGPAQNTFGTATTANRAAAEALRDTYANANTAWLAEYDGDRSFYIQLVWTGNASVVQRRNAAGTGWEDVTGIIRGTRGATGAPGSNAVAQVLAFLESSTSPAAPTVTQDTSNSLTFTDSWSLDYPANPTDAVYSVAVRYTIDGTARTVPATDVEGPFKITGSPGNPGASGGGALVSIGTFTGDLVANIHTDAGFDWPVDSDYFGYETNDGAAIFWVYGPSIYGNPGITAAAIGAASANANRLRMNEATGGDVGGNLYFGRTADDRATISSQNASTGITIRFWRYVPGDATTQTGPRGFPGTDGAGASPPAEDEGVQVVATPTAYNFVGAGVVVTEDGGKAKVTISGGGGGGGGMVTDDIYFGTSADATPEGSELTIAAVNGVGTIAAYVGDMRHLIARLATEPDISSVLYSDDQSNTNQIGAFTKFGSTVVPTGEALAFAVWVTNQALAQSADVELTVS